VPLRRLAAVLTLVAAVAAATSGPAGAASAPAPGVDDAGAEVSPAPPITCEDLPVQPGHMTCLSEIGQPITRPFAARTSSTVTPEYTNYSPLWVDDIESIYGLPAYDAATAAQQPGSGPTVAVVLAGMYPNIATDLDHFRTSQGNTLGKCDTSDGCLTLMNQEGSTDPAEQAAEITRVSNGTVTYPWRAETMLDVEAVSATCPFCKILVVGTNTSSVGDMEDGVRAAVAAGAEYVSMSFGANETPSDVVRRVFTGIDDVTFLAATGDDGYTSSSTGGVFYPAASPNVVAVGGTSVTKQRVAGSTQWATAAWSGAGSGCSAYEVGTAVQRLLSIIGSACGTSRATADISALADPNTGFAMYLPTTNNPGGWMTIGGTSLATPLLAGMYASVGNHTDPLSIYQPAAASSITDVISGETTGCASDTDVRCAAGVGWDGPTGLGTPNSPNALALNPVTPTPAAPTTSAAPVVPLPLPTIVPSLPVPSPTPPSPTEGATSPSSPSPSSPAPSPGKTPTKTGGTSSRLITHAGGQLRIAGRPDTGRRLRAKAGSWHISNGRPRVRITWYVNGRAVHRGHRLFLKPRWKGGSAFYRVRVAARGYTTQNYRSPVVQIH